ncbi:uncharacterized protein LOC111630655 [Centruroides sculpturatus]|uniref:uncharacterized protein LOC111630655 n=1 Tax=Centruroides sculpturatus TaxID=218467 RepID=UPI000C6D4DFA|nr:uncharacterized protein LOC111630655 [Centruroides sculpturatus]XP_023230561.1 uncharacterized protein LOC111630655 [Centruroides sculpturatus]
MVETQVAIETGGGGEVKCDTHPDNRTKWWTIDAVRIKMAENSLWTVCKAMTVGVLLIVIGAGMATVGFYSEYLSRVEEQRGNTTIWVKNESRDTHLGSLTYIGPVVMGTGGFIIVAACVMTFEARDTAAKIVPVWLRKGRNLAIPGTATSSRRSSQTSWERFLSRSRRRKRERTAVTQALIDFSLQIQNSVDSRNISTASDRNALRKCPSDPMIFRRTCNEQIADTKPLQLSSTPQPSSTQRDSNCLAPTLQRQAISVDSPQCPSTTLTVPNNIPGKESTQSLAVDVYLPQGPALTLKVKDEGRDTKATTDDQATLLLVPTVADRTGSIKRRPLLRQSALDTCNEDDISDESS